MFKKVSYVVWYSHTRVGERGHDTNGHDFQTAALDVQYDLKKLKLSGLFEHLEWDYTILEYHNDICIHFNENEEKEELVSREENLITIILGIAENFQINNFRQIFVIKTSFTGLLWLFIIAKLKVNLK